MFFVLLPALLIILPAACPAEEPLRRYFPPAIEGPGYTAAEFGEVAGMGDPVGRLIQDLGAGRLSDLRSQSVASALGEVRLFTPPALPSRFRTPLPAILSETVEAVSSVLAGLGLQDALSPGSGPISIIVLNEVPRAADSGILSSSVCHSAWTGPPANIVIAADRLQTHCGTATNANRDIEAELRDVLIHELAHVIEFRLMGEAFARRARWHGEGFAMWFETAVQARFGTPASEAFNAERRAKARELYAEKWRAGLFSGSRKDYLNSYVRIAALVDYLSPEALLEIYSSMREAQCGFLKAAELCLGLTEHGWNSLASRFLEVEPPVL